MWDKSELQSADTELLVATALECCNQQQQMLGRESRFDEEWVTEFQRFEELRDYTLHLINWQDAGLVLQYKEALQQLWTVDQQNGQQLREARDELASRLRNLRRKRNISSEYLSFQGPDGR